MFLDRKSPGDDSSAQRMASQAHMQPIDGTRLPPAFNGLLQRSKSQDDLEDWRNDSPRTFDLTKSTLTRSHSETVLRRVASGLSARFFGAPSNDQTPRSHVERDQLRQPDADGFRTERTHARSTPDCASPGRDPLRKRKTSQVRLRQGQKARRRESSNMTTRQWHRFTRRWYRF